jgi:hypothetical protein
MAAIIGEGVPAMEVLSGGISVALGDGRKNASSSP